MNTVLKYDKVFVLDTNILLTNADYIFQLSQKSSNLIVIPETVLDELDNKKSGFDEINFQARKFARILSDKTTKIVKTEKGQGYNIVDIELKDGEKISIVGKEKYEVTTKDTPLNIINDRKIIEVAQYTNDLYKRYGLETILLSNDMMMRTRAISQQLKTSSVDEKQKDIKFDFLYEQDYDFEVEPKDGMNLESIESNKSSFIFHNTVTGKPYYGIRENNKLKLLEEKMLDRQMARPKNAEQKFMSALILSPYTDIIVINGHAGTGKNYISTSSAMRLMDTRRDLYSSIVYIRKTVISDDKQGEVGFLPGSLEEKMAGYLAPLYNTLENFIKDQHKNDKKQMSKEDIESGVSELIQKYDIDTKYLGHLRGSTISNAIVIIDEAQNMTKLDMQTTLSRMGRDVKVLVMGSQKQIDNPYLNQYNNALTYLNGLVGDERNDDMGVRIVGCELKKSVRSAISEWTDHVF